MKNQAVLLVLGVVLVVLVAVGTIYLINQSRQATKEPSPLYKPTVVPTAVTEAVTTTGQPPTAATLTLNITSPATGTTVTTPSVAVKGKTLPNVEVFVNDKETVADKNGNFSASLSLEEGDNYILVVANDSDGNSVEQELLVIYEIK